MNIQDVVKTLELGANTTIMVADYTTQRIVYCGKLVELEAGYRTKTLAKVGRFYDGFMFTIWQEEN